MYETKNYYFYNGRNFIFNSFTTKHPGCSITFSILENKYVSDYPISFSHVDRLYYGIFYRWKILIQKERLINIICPEKENVTGWTINERI